MTALSASAQANASGTATVSISPNKSGIQWAVAQISVECKPSRATQNVTVRVNGNYFTSSASMPDVASGAPAQMLQAMDIMTFDFAGCTSGDSCIVTIYYTESQWGSVPRVDVV